MLPVNDEADKSQDAQLSPESIDSPANWFDDVPEPPQPTANGYVKTSIFDFLQKPHRKREHIMGPFVKQGLNMVYAPPGVGKTFFSTSLAFAMATKGRFLNWECEIKQRVIYFDGELPAFVLQDRLKALMQQNPGCFTSGATFDIVTPDEQSNPMPDLSTSEGQQAALELIGDAEFIVLDNISTLCRSGEENSAESWIPVQNWLLRLRAMGKSVLLVHHSGKGPSNNQRGTSKREDVLDTVISLAHPAGYSAQSGCQFEMKFKKSRHFRTELDTQEVVAKYSSNYGWEVQSLSDSLMNQVESLKTMNPKMSQRAIAEELGLSQATVFRLLKSLKNATKIDIDTPYDPDQPPF